MQFHYYYYYINDVHAHTPYYCQKLNYCVVGSKKRNKTEAFE